MGRLAHDAGRDVLHPDPRPIQKPLGSRTKDGDDRDDERSQAHDQRCQGVVSVSLIPESTGSCPAARELGLDSPSLPTIRNMTPMPTSRAPSTRRCPHNARWLGWLDRCSKCRAPRSQARTAITTWNKSAAATLTSAASRVWPSHPIKLGETTFISRSQAVKWRTCLFGLFKT